MDHDEGITEPNPVDVRARAFLEQGNVQSAATEIVNGYGPELLGWLRAVARSEAEGDDVFSIVCERLWKSLSDFDWRASIRTWMYVVGRNALRDQYRRRRGAEIPVSEAPELAAAIRTTTAAYRKTVHKDRLSKLRDALEPDERTLLILRVDRGLPWRDIAEILSGGTDDPEELKRTSARARKQFGRLKERLKAAWEQSSTPS